MRSNLISLRSLLKEDSECYFRWINDRDLVLNNAPYKPITQLEHENWFNQIASYKDRVIFSIVENQSGKLIGTCSLRNINLLHRNAELQIRIGESDFHNRGYGTEAVNLLIKHAFSDLNLIRIYLHVFCDNISAIRSYQKCNFQTEGTLRKAAYVNGKYVDVHLMSILNDDVV